MKVILLKDVLNVGETGSIQDVSEGFARNYLIPQGLAEMGTPGKVKEAQQRIRSQERKIEREEAALSGLAGKIDGQRIAIVARVGSQGRLYGSITAQEIAETLSSQIGEDIDRRKIVLSDPIRTVGDHTVEVHLVGRLRPAITVSVNPSEDSVVEESEETGESADAELEAVEAEAGEEEATATAEE
jgi:large subunit ribosomal protein L9